MLYSLNNFKAWASLGVVNILSKSFNLCSGFGASKNCLSIKFFLLATAVIKFPSSKLPNTVISSSVLSFINSKTVISPEEKLFSITDFATNIEGSIESIKTKKTIPKVIWFFLEWNFVILRYLKNLAKASEDKIVKAKLENIIAILKSINLKSKSNITAKIMLLNKKTLSLFSLKAP